MTELDNDDGKNVYRKQNKKHRAVLYVYHHQKQTNKNTDFSPFATRSRWSRTTEQNNRPLKKILFFVLVDGGRLCFFVVVLFIKEEHTAVARVFGLLIYSF